MRPDVPFVARLAVIYLLMQGVGFAATWRHTSRLAADRSSAIRRKFLVFFGITLGVFLSAYFRYPFIGAAAAIVLAGLFEIVRLSTRNRPAFSLALPIYLVIGAGFFAFAVRSRVAVIMGIYAAIVALDGFSQVSGQWFGRTRLAPAISPGKTLEGLLGGLAASSVAYAILVDFEMDARKITTLVVVLLAGFAGDLLGSLYKRRTGVKDFSELIPYHGGVLDRFDSFMLAGCAYVAVSLFGFGL